jgi:hypothetical protein
VNGDDLGPPRWVWLALVALTVAVVVVVIVAAFKISNVQDLQRRSDCRSKVEAEFFTGVADALNAPPAPNPAREAAGAEILKAGKDMKNLANTCG